MRVQVLTIFPELFSSFLATSLIGKAIESGKFVVEVFDLREFTKDRHRSVDDEPYGGGGGMVMTAPPWIDAVRTLASTNPEGEDTEGRDAERDAPGSPQAHRILLSPQGRRLDDSTVRGLAKKQHLILLCGRYEGIDERVRQTVVDEELSIGDYVLSGGELPAMVLIEALSRQIPGVVGLEDSVINDSFRDGLLDFPHYTRPRDVEGLEVPEILLSGHHAKITAWRRRQALRATLEKRPELLPRTALNDRDRHDLNDLARELQIRLPNGLATTRQDTDN